MEAPEPAGGPHFIMTPRGFQDILYTTPRLKPNNPMGSPLTVTYLMGVLVFLSLTTLFAFVFTYVIYREGAGDLTDSGRNGSNKKPINYEVCNDTYCRNAALYYMGRLRAPIDMCDQMATSLCHLTAGQNASSASPVSMVKGHLHLHSIDIDAMLKEQYFPIAQLKQFLHMCIKSTRKSGIRDFVGIMKRFDMEHWPVTSKTANLTKLLAAITTQLGYYPLVTISLAKGYESHRPVVSLDKPTLLLRKVGSQTDMTMAATLLFTLTKYLKEFCDRYAVCLQRGEAEHIVTTIIKFEQLLSFYMRAPGKQTRTKVKDMHTNKIHWPTLLTAVLGQHHNITPETDVVIKSPHYLKGLDEVLERSSESVVTLYVGYTIFSWFAPLIVNLDASTNVLTSQNSEHNRLWSKFQCLLLSEGVFGFAYLHVFASLPGFDVAQKAIINATKLIIKALQEFTIITPWFKKEDAELIYRKLDLLEVSAFVPDVAKIRRFVQEYYNKVPNLNTEDGFLRNLFQMQKFVTERHLDLVIGPNGEAYMWPISSLRKRCWLDVQANKLYIPAIHSILVHPSTRSVRFLQVPVLAYYVLHALLPMFFHAGSVFDERGAYDEWWNVENEESFSRAEQCLVQQYLESTKSDASQEEAKAMAAQVMNQNFILAPSFEAFKYSLEGSRYSMSNFSLHQNFPADSKHVFYAAHMMALCDETDTAQNSFIYRMFNEELSDFYRHNVPFYNFPEYEDQVSDCEPAQANELSKIRHCRIWNPY
ncbi:neprilysin-1-like [Dermacentor albipictus]|uniref:neprilysin-1-like n=1 Tax=Dermacentor albipictus TaxID=60249 RepID=UPI0031FDD8FF